MKGGPFLRFTERPMVCRKETDVAVARKVAPLYFVRKVRQ